MDFGGFGWRDGVLLAAMLAAVYLVVALLGLARLKRRRRTPEVGIEPTASEPFEPPTLTTAEAAPAPAAQPALADPDGPEPEPPRSAFGARLAQAELEAEVRQLRADVTALRQEVAALKASRRISPHYAEAAALAERGFDARGVADECGISVAEAELVLAMSRDDQDFDKEVEDGSVRRVSDAAA